MSSKDIKKKKNTKPSKHSNVDSKKNIKNNKGFTLVEIIGVVIILGILVTVGAMSVRGYIESSKAKTYESYKKELSGATKNLFIDCMTNNEEDCVIPKKGNDVKLTYQELLDKGYSKRLKDPDGDGYCDKSYVIAKNSGEDVSNIEYQVCLFCNNYKSTENGCVENNSNDTTPPTCGEKSGEGSEDNWTSNNRVITVKCIDGESGCKKTEFSRSIGYDGQVTKKSTVKIEDNAGNKVNCKVNAYVDREKPTCTLEIEQSSSTGWYAGSVTVKLKSTSDGEGSGVAETGMGTSLMNRKYNSMDSYTVKSGIVTVFGYVKDKVGNEGYCSKEVKIDDTKPTGSVYMGYQVYPKENAVISGETITISNLEKYGNIDGVAITLKNNLGIVHSAISAKGDDKSLKVSGGIQVGKKFGVIKITKGTYDKLAITVPGSTSSNQIEKVELIKNENVTSVWTNKNVSVYFEAKDTITGVGSYSYDGGKTFGSENIKYFSQNTTNSIQVKDKAGNVSINYSFEINKIDKEAPKITLVTYKCSNSSCDASSNGTFQESLTTQGNVGAKTIDWNNTGGKFNYEINDGSLDYETWEWNKSGNYAYTDPTQGKVTHEASNDETTLTNVQTLTAEGYRTGKITAYDKAGNSSSITVAVKIDKTNPKIKLDTYKCSDASCKNDGKLQQTLTTQGNVGASTIDWNNTGGKFNYEISDANFDHETWEWNESGNYKYTAPTYGKETHNTLSGTHTLTAQGYRTGKITAYDKAGNSSSITVAVKIDKTKPEVIVKVYKCSDASCNADGELQQTITAQGGKDANTIAWNNTGGKFKYEVNDANFYYETWYWNDSGNKYCYSPTGNNNETHYASSGTHTLTAQGCRTGKITVYDKAGNSSTVSVSVKIDKTAPNLQISNPYSNTWSREPYKLSFNGSSDNLSGIRDYAWRYANTSYVLFNGTDADQFSRDRDEDAYIRACDYAGNCTEKTTRIKIDKTPPTAVYNPSKFYVSQVTSSGTSLDAKIYNSTCDSTNRTCTVNICFRNRVAETDFGYSETVGQIYSDSGSGLDYKTRSVISKTFYDGTNIGNDACEHEKAPCYLVYQDYVYDKAGNKLDGYKITYVYNYYNNNSNPNDNLCK